jgi:hypothetical protein
MNTVLPSIMNTINNDCVKVICNFLEDPRPLLCVLNLSINEQKIVIDPLICVWETIRIMDAVALLPFSFCGITGFENVKNAKRKFSFYIQNVQESSLKKSIQKTFESFENYLFIPANFGCEWRFPQNINCYTPPIEPLKEFKTFSVEKVFDTTYLTKLQEMVRRKDPNPSYAFILREFEKTVEVYGKKKNSFDDAIKKLLKKDAEILNWD